jgi:hypothetical protein
MAQKKTSSNLRRFAEAAENGFHGYHGESHTLDRVIATMVLGGEHIRVSTPLEVYVAQQAKDVYSSCASYEENCERAYRQMNDAVKRLRRVRDAFGRTIGKCR